MLPDLANEAEDAHTIGRRHWAFAMTLIQAAKLNGVDSLAMRSAASSCHLNAETAPAKVWCPEGVVKRLFA